ncbi:CHASE domain-containing protein [Roseibium salinum]|nr:CHASE domain-containing protein [Roseibium salinum]
MQNRSVHLQRARTNVGEQLGMVRARLEGNVNSNLQLVRGLVALIATQPDIDQDQFGRISSSLIGNHSQLRNVAGAPDLVVSLMYPMAGNEKAIGLDYRKNEQQRDAALRAVRSGQMVLAGPVNLLQGGTGFVGRFPVFTEKCRWHQGPVGPRCGGGRCRAPLCRQRPSRSGSSDRNRTLRPRCDDEGQDPLLRRG